VYATPKLVGWFRFPVGWYRRFEKEKRYLRPVKSRVRRWWVGARGFTRGGIIYSPPCSTACERGCVLHSAMKRKWALSDNTWHTESSTKTRCKRNSYWKFSIWQKSKCIYKETSAKSNVILFCYILKEKNFKSKSLATPYLNFELVKLHNRKIFFTDIRMHSTKCHALQSFTWKRISMR